MKTSPIPVGWYYISYFVLSLPYQCFKFLTDDLADKLSMGFSNVPGSREDWFITGKRMIAQGFSIPLGKTVPMGWAAISHKDNIKICVNSDKASVQDIEWLMNKFETNLDDFLGSKEWRSFDPGQKK